MVRTHYQGLLLASAVAVAGYFLGILKLGLPAIVIALLIGMALNPIAIHSRFETGLTFAVKKILRYAIALLGLRISMHDVQTLGLSSAILIAISMVVTVAGSFFIARILGLSSGFAALNGAANAVCGASATLATASVVPDYQEKTRDIAFVVIMANAISTLFMLAYPIIGYKLGLNDTQFGLLLGATIQDMAQVVGAGYAVSEPVGNSATIVKLFRVVLLLPMVLAIGYYLARKSTKASVPVPYFAVVFIAFMMLNPYIYAPLKHLLIQVSYWGMLIAVAALGLQTSLQSLVSVGIKPVLAFFATSMIILLIILLDIYLLLLV